MRRRPPVNYINKKDFLILVVEHNIKVKEAKENGTKLPNIPEKIGQAFLALSTRIATKHQFRGYMFVDEMVADGYEECCRRMHNFDPAKTENPFGYFSKVIWNTFLRKIKAEKLALKTKLEMTERLNIMGLVSDTQSNDDNNYAINVQQTNETMEYMR